MNHFYKKSIPITNLDFLMQQQTRGAAETIFKALNKLFTEKIRYPINMIQMKQQFDKPVLCLMRYLL